MGKKYKAKIEINPELIFAMFEIGNNLKFKNAKYSRKKQVFEIGYEINSNDKEINNKKYNFDVKKAVDEKITFTIVSEAGDIT